MRIVVTHVTRMREGRVCVAGVERQTMVHVRPVSRAGQLTWQCLAAGGGVFALGNEVDLGSVRHCGSPPELEDHEFDPARARLTGRVDAAELWALLCGLAKDDPVAVFGPALHTPDGRPHSLATRPGEGKVSLGVWRPSKKPRVERKDGRLRLECDCSLGSRTSRCLRLRIAREERIPAYMVFPDRTLREMAVRRPRSPEELLAIPGVGPVKLEKYGPAFLSEIADYRREVGRGD